MVYRTAPYVPRCRSCGAAAETSCTRCRAPLCPEHRHGQAERCAGCEERFEERHPASDLTAETGKLFAFLYSSSLLLLLALALATTGAVLFLVPAANLISLAGGASLVRHQRRRARARFLEERFELA